MSFSDEAWSREVHIALLWLPVAISSVRPKEGRIDKIDFRCQDPVMFAQDRPATTDTFAEQASSNRNVFSSKVSVLTVFQVAPVYLGN